MQNTKDLDRHAVGFRQRTLKFGGTPLPVGIWYPTADEERTNFFGPFAMRVALEAPPVRGNGHLVVISHGSKGNHLGHRDTAHHLAACGYTVTAPLHPHDNYLDDSDSGTPKLWRNRPEHVRCVADAVLADPLLGPFLQPDRCGIVGFSLGGYTALSLLGARGGLGALVRHCRCHPDDQLPVAPDEAGPPLDELEHMLDEEGDLFPPARDGRFKAAVLMAPMCAMFTDDALRAVGVPVSLYCAERDDVLREPHHSHRLASLLPRLKHFRVVPGAGHFSFLCPFPGVLHKELAELAIDAADFDRPAFHEALNLDVARFFGEHLLRSAPCAVA